MNKEYKTTILLYPDTHLDRGCFPITDKCLGTLENITREMFNVMYASKGVGLAAPQIGMLRRLFVMNITGDPTQKDKEHIFWNPNIAFLEEPLLMEEGCLSVPNVLGMVPRCPEIEFVAQTPEGEFRGGFEGFEAQVIQHEVDHLRGKLFIDVCSTNERRRVLIEYKKKKYM